MVVEIRLKYPHINPMSTIPTIPCPVCQAPVYVRSLQLPGGEISSIYAEPMVWDETLVAFHEHQAADMVNKQLH